MTALRGKALSIRLGEEPEGYKAWLQEQEAMRAEQAAPAKQATLAIEAAPAVEAAPVEEAPAAPVMVQTDETFIPLAQARPKRQRCARAN